MTREELQRLYDQCVTRAFRAEQLAGLVRGVESFLAEPDPTVEIAYLKAKLADVEAGRDQEARVKELRGAAEAYLATHLHGNSAWINREHVAQWLHDRADAIESGANHA